MKKKTTKIRLSKFKFLLFLPLLLLSFCDSNLGDPTLNVENRLTKDAKVFSLMKAAIQNDSDQNMTKNKGVMSKSTTTQEDDQCTYFLYPMTFKVYSGDNPNPKLKEINSDEELIAFIDTFTFENEMIASTPNYEFYIYFPIVLLDTDGVETELNNLTELEGTLEMAVEACASFNDDSDDDATDDDATDDASDDDNNDSDDDAGIHNAHFDVDTSHLVYDFNDGKTDAHTHEYDDKYDTNIVDYFNILNDDKKKKSKKKNGLRNINDLEFGVPNDSEQFYIIIANAELSQDVQLEINGDLISVMDYQSKVDAYLNGDHKALEAYALGGASDATQLTSLKFIVGLDASSVKNGLIPTETKTVVKNTPGPNGEYRDGALLIQAININKMSLNPGLGVAHQDAGLFWESTIFWHVKDKGSDNDHNDDYDYCDKKKKKVSICHNGKTICVSVNALYGHTQHKDCYPGSCTD